MREWPDGRVKMATTALLALRREHAGLFVDGDYQPIVVEGDEADWALGYTRACGGKRVAVLSPVPHASGSKTGVEGSGAIA